MIRVLVHVEGQTEEVFVKEVLQARLLERNVLVIPTIVTTKRVAGGPNHKGGVSSWEKIERELRLLLCDTAAVAVTTMFDFYAIPQVPGTVATTSSDPYVRVNLVEDAMNRRIDDRRFRAHLMLHEFETMLYASPAACSSYLGVPALKAAMDHAVSTCGAPELINDQPTTAPSARLLSAYPSYAKTLDGPVLADEIGLEAIRAACPHFEGWINYLESLENEVVDETG